MDANMKNILLLFLFILFPPQLFPQDVVTPNDISGTWELMEWHDGDDVLRPPMIGGLFALVNGNFSGLVSILLKDCTKQVMASMTSLAIIFGTATITGLQL
jgi:hypothetical protein